MQFLRSAKKVQKSEQGRLLCNVIFQCQALTAVTSCPKDCTYLQGHSHSHWPHADVFSMKEH